MVLDTERPMNDDEIQDTEIVEFENIIPHIEQKQNRSSVSPRPKWDGSSNIEPNFDGARRINETLTLRSSNVKRSYSKEVTKPVVIAEEKANKSMNETQNSQISDTQIMR